MTGGGSDAPPMPPPANGGQFLLSLLQNPNHRPQASPQPQSQATPFTPPPPQQPQQSFNLDPAVAAVGPSLPFTPPLWPSNGFDFLSPPPGWPHNFSPSPLPPSFPGFHQNPWPSPSGNQSQRVFVDDIQRLGLSSMDTRANNTIHNLVQHKQPVEQKLQFGSFTSEIRNSEDLLNMNAAAKERERRNFNGPKLDLQVNSNSKNLDLDRRGGGGWGTQRQGGNYMLLENRISPPPGFSSKPRRGGGGNWDNESRRRELEHDVSKDKGNHGEFSIRGTQAKRLRSPLPLGLTGQLDHPGPPAGSTLHSVLASDKNLDVVEGDKDIDHEVDDAGEFFDSLLLEDEADARNGNKKREKEARSDNRGQHMLSQRMRMLKRQVECRREIGRWNAQFLAIYESLIPLEEERAKQKQLLALLEKLVNKEWPDARLYLYGSCANSFGVSKSDIDVCLAIEDPNISKSEVLLKLADILISDNLQNVQALTRARVPIVKLMDPVTGISCDICMNNILAVVNTKLLRDYAQIDVRLRQLAFIVKHWAKSRGVNETYQGTLSSYAYVLMCIHFLQQRRPAILPCLQEMETTYSVTVDDIKCSYFDQVEKLRGFGFHNKETIAQLVWAFFNYWAYRHDYANDVISVRTGSIISKREKDWTRRIGNDRHLICIEDPFEISHDLGRVVDKYSIKVLREEFERAADIMQNNPSPCVALFEPYVAE